MGNAKKERSSEATERGEAYINLRALKDYSFTDLMDLITEELNRGTTPLMVLRDIFKVDAEDLASILNISVDDYLDSEIGARPFDAGEYLDMTHYFAHICRNYGMETPLSPAIFHIYQNEAAPLDLLRACRNYLKNVPENYGSETYRLTAEFYWLQIEQGYVFTGNRDDDTDILGNACSAYLIASQGPSYSLQYVFGEKAVHLVTKEGVHALADAIDTYYDTLSELEIEPIGQGEIQRDIRQFEKALLQLSQKLAGETKKHELLAAIDAAIIDFQQQCDPETQENIQDPSNIMSEADFGQHVRGNLTEFIKCALNNVTGKDFGHFDALKYSADIDKMAELLNKRAGAETLQIEQSMLRKSSNIRRQKIQSYHGGVNPLEVAGFIFNYVRLGSYTGYAWIESLTNHLNGPNKANPPYKLITHDPRLLP